MSILRYARGYLRIRVIGGSPERFLNTCSHRGIDLWGIIPVRGTYEMYISVAGFRKLKPIIRKTQTKVIVKERLGLPFYVFRYRRRKAFFVSGVLGLALIYLLSLFVWDIDIQGNQKYTDETLLAFLKDQGITHGMRLSGVDCTEIVKDLRRQYDEIIWVSASIEGCKLIVQIKENEDSREIQAADNQEESEDSAYGWDLVADQSGTITEIIVRRGIPLVKEGQQVKKGDVLVTGAVPVLNDSGEIAGYQFQESDADVRAQVELTYDHSQSLSFQDKRYEGGKKRGVYLRVWNWLFTLGGTKTKATLWDSFTREKQMSLGEHFGLPVSWGTFCVSPYQTEERNYSKEQVQTLLSEAFQRDKKTLEKKGVEIIRNNVKIYTGSAEATARGSLTVLMSIGTKQATETDRLEQTDTMEEEPDGND